MKKIKRHGNDFFVSHDALSLLKRERNKLISDKKRGLVMTSAEQTVNKKIESLERQIECLSSVH